MSHDNSKSPSFYHAALCFILSLGMMATLRADDVPAGVDRPLMTVGIASLDRIERGVQHVFDSVKRPELGTWLNVLMGSVGNLKGWDHSRPFGAMVLINPGIAPEPVIVGFAPIDDWDTVLESHANGLIRIEPAKEHDDRYDLSISPDNKFLVRVVGDYAFITKQAKSLNREFADPKLWFGDAPRRYDVWSTVHFEHVPVGLRTVIFDYLRAGAQEKLIRLSGESDDDYLLRTAATEGTIDGFELLTTHGLSGTAGWRIDEDQHRMLGEVVIVSKPESELALMFYESGQANDRFSRMTSTDSLLYVSTAWGVSDRLEAMMQTILKVGYEEGLQEIPEHLREGHPLPKIYELLKRTVAARQINQFISMTQNPSGALTIVGGMHFSNRDELEEAMHAVYRASLKESKFTIQTDADHHRGLAIHRVNLASLDERLDKLTGENAAFYVVQSGDELLYAFGDSHALATLKSSIDRLSPPQNADEASRVKTILHVSVKPTNWLSLLMGHDELTKAESSESAPPPKDDHLQVRIDLDQNELRLSFTLDDGCVRLIESQINPDVNKRQTPTK